MRSACGQAGYGLSTNRMRFSSLHTAVMHYVMVAVCKARSNPLFYTHLVQQQTHSFLTRITTVTTTFIPTIHTTNKNYKNFYLNNLLLINRSCV